MDHHFTVSNAVTGKQDIYARPQPLEKEVQQEPTTTTSPPTPPPRRTIPPKRREPKTLTFASNKNDEGNGSCNIYQEPAKHAEQIDSITPVEMRKGMLTSHKSGVKNNLHICQTQAPEKYKNMK